MYIPLCISVYADRKAYTKLLNNVLTVYVTKADLKFKVVRYLHKVSLLVHLFPIFYGFKFFKNNYLCSDLADGFLIPFCNIFVITCFCVNKHAMFPTPSDSSYNSEKMCVCVCLGVLTA